MAGQHESVSDCYGTANLSMILPWVTHEWQPSTDKCELMDWNHNDFWKTFANMTVEIIGDSLSYEMYTFLALLMGLESHSDDQHWSLKYNRDLVNLACRNKETKLVF
jgi:hypothetical protein